MRIEVYRGVVRLKLPKLFQTKLVGLVKELGWWNNEAEIDQSGTTHLQRKLLHMLGNHVVFEYV